MMGLPGSWYCEAGLPSAKNAASAHVVCLTVPVKETSASLSMPSSWMLSLSDLELPLDLFMLRKYWPHLCRPASFFNLFSLARLFWNHTWKVKWWDVLPITDKNTAVKKLQQRKIKSLPSQFTCICLILKTIVQVRAVFFLNVHIIFAQKQKCTSRTVKKWLHVFVSPSGRLKQWLWQVIRRPLHWIYHAFN